MNMKLTGRIIPTRLFCFLCVLASLCQLNLGCSQDFLDVLGPGVRVKRGPDWKWGVQDGNGLGTITTEISSSSWISVKWDNGHTNSYRVGHQNKCDLALVDVLETQCNFFPTNMTDTGDFLLSYQDFPRPVHTHYRCHKHIQSPDESMVVALHILMLDTCNTSIYDGASSNSSLIKRGCNMVPATYVSSQRDLYLETFKAMGTKYGFMAYITYEPKECEKLNVIKAEKGVRGYFSSPYSKFVLGSAIYCRWLITADPDQVVEVTITFLDNERQLHLTEEDAYVSTRINFSKKPVSSYTSKSSKVTLKYDKYSEHSKGFYVVYSAKDKPKEPQCPEIDMAVEAGKSGFLKLPDYHIGDIGRLRCRWKLNAMSESSLIHLKINRINATKCSYNDVILVNGVSFPSKAACTEHSFSLIAQTFNISYMANTPNQLIILEYEATKPEVCFQDTKISANEKKKIIFVPDNSSLEIKSPCEWRFISAETQRISLEIVSSIDSEWKPNNAFLVFNGKNWTQLNEEKFTSEGNQVLLKYDISKLPIDFAGKLFLTYKAVSPAKKPTTPLTFWTQKIATTSVTPVTPMTPMTPIGQISTLSIQASVECSQSGVPIWCYVVLVLLSIACFALFITSVTLYRRQIYVCDEHGSLLNLRLQDIIAKDDI